MSHGKSLLKRLRAGFQAEFGETLRDVAASEHILVLHFKRSRKKCSGGLVLFGCPSSGTSQKGRGRRGQIKAGHRLDKRISAGSKASGEWPSSGGGEMGRSVNLVKSR
jgi:hypothetical protein